MGPKTHQNQKAIMWICSSTVMENLFAHLLCKQALSVMVLSFPSLWSPPGEVTRDNPYEDVKLSPMCLPITRPPAPKVNEDILLISPFHNLEIFSISCVWPNQMIPA